MEVDEHFKSNFEGLVHQVDEQSEFCDVTVKTDDWRKKFHRCVLSASLLFQIIFDTKEAGKCVKADIIPDDHLEVKIETTPNVVEMAIMFMYGRLPEFDMGNIGDLLEIAEYLMIKELKHACINWLNRLDYSEDTCMFVIHLSTKYDFDILTCNEYIESHIPDILLTDEATDLSCESVEYLFINDRLSYVTIVDKFNFLVKWVKKHPSERTKESIIKLFKTHGLNEDINHALVNNNGNAISILNVENILRQTEQEDSRKRLILMTSAIDYIACLDIKNDRWYRLNSNYFDEYRYHVEIAGLRNDNPEVIFKEGTFSRDVLTTLDLESDQIHQYELQLDLNDVLNGDIFDVDVMFDTFKNDTVVVIVKTTTQTYEDSNSPESEPKFVVVSAERALNDSSIESAERVLNYSSTDEFCVIEAPELQINDQSTSTYISDTERDVTINFFTVYVGNASENIVEMHPLFTFLKEEIIQTCINNHSVLALLTKLDGLMHVTLYDILQFRMETIFSLQEGKYELCSTDKGFLLYDDTQCYCFTKLEVPFFSKKYKVENFQFEREQYWLAKYRYQSGFWIRILRRSIKQDIELQYISHEELAIGKIQHDINWRNLSIPKDEKVAEIIMNFENIFIATLSKRKLRCNIACPHCKFPRDFELL